MHVVKGSNEDEYFYMQHKPQPCSFLQIHYMFADYIIPSSSSLLLEVALPSHQFPGFLHTIILNSILHSSQSVRHDYSPELKIM